MILRIHNPVPWLYTAKVVEGDVWVEFNLRPLEGLGGKWIMKIYKGNISGRPLGRRQRERAEALRARALAEFEAALRDAGWTDVETVFAGAPRRYWIAPAQNES